MTTSPQSSEQNNPAKRPVHALVAASFAIVLSFMQLYLAVVIIPRFASIFLDMGGHSALPPLTAIVINSRWLLVGLSAILSTLAAVAVHYRPSSRYVYACVVLSLLLIWATMLAVVFPLIVTIQAVDSPS